MEHAVPIQFNKAHYPVTVLGPGQRLGLWLQGCSIRCPGCISQDTWEPSPENGTTVGALLHACRGFCTSPPDGITISGGEPFDQPLALAALLAGLDDWRRDLPAPCDILVYSGYDLAYIEHEHADLLALIDVLIPGPFIRSRSESMRWRGSDNQSVALLTPLGRERWSTYELESPNTRSLQVVVDETKIWAIGIPRIGDMDALSRLAAERGLNFGGVSW